MERSSFLIVIALLISLPYILAIAFPIRAQETYESEGKLAYSLGIVNETLLIEFVANISGTDGNNTFLVISIGGQPLDFESLNGSILKNVTLGLIEATLLRNITAYIVTIINGSAHMVYNVSVDKDDISVINPVTSIDTLIVPSDSDLNGFADVVRSEVRVYLRDMIGEDIVNSVVRELSRSVFLVCGGVYSRLDNAEYVPDGGYVRGVYSCSDVDRLVGGNATVSVIYSSRHYSGVLDAENFGPYLSVFESRDPDLEVKISIGSKEFETYLHGEPSVFNVGYYPVGDMELGVGIINRGLGVANLTVVVSNESRSCSFLGMNSSINYGFRVGVGEGLNIISVRFLHKGTALGKKTVVVRGYDYSCLGVSAEAVGDYLKLTFSNACNISVSGFVRLGDKTAYFSVGEGQSISSYLRYRRNSSLVTLPFFVKTFVGYAYAGNVTVQVTAPDNGRVNEAVSVPQGIPWYVYVLVAATGVAAGLIAWRHLIRRGSRG